MKEAVFIILVLLVLLALTTYRYRNQIRSVYRVWQMISSMRKMQRPETNEIGDDAKNSSGPLVNCSKCSTWVPADRALKLPGGIYFCSQKCLEKTA